MLVVKCNVTLTLRIVTKSLSNVFCYTWLGFEVYFNPIQDGHFRGCSRMGGGGGKPLLPKICHKYPTMMKLGTVIPYLKKIQKINELCDTPPEFC